MFWLYILYFAEKSPLQTSNITCERSFRVRVMKMVGLRPSVCGKWRRTSLFLLISDQGLSIVRGAMWPKHPRVYICIICCWAGDKRKRIIHVYTLKRSLCACMIFALHFSARHWAAANLVLSLSICRPPGHIPQSIIYKTEITKGHKEEQLYLLLRFSAYQSHTLLLSANGVVPGSCLFDQTKVKP